VGNIHDLIKLSNIFKENFNGNNIFFLKINHYIFTKVEVVMNKLIVFFLAIFLFILANASDDFVKGTVTAGKLNVRVLPGQSYTAVAKIAKGTEIKIYTEKDGWYEVDVPDDASVWIYSGDISDDGIVRKNTFLRSGSDITYTPYSRKALEGERLKIIEKRNNWVKVFPPEGLKAWVSSEFIEVKDAHPKIKKLSGNSDKIGEEEELQFENIPEKSASYEGFLVLLKDNSSVKYALVLDVNGALAPVCYVSSKNENLDTWINKKVKISGAEKWVKGWRRPLLILENIDKVN